MGTQGEHHTLLYQSTAGTYNYILVKNPSHTTLPKEAFSDARARVLLAYNGTLTMQGFHYCITCDHRINSHPSGSGAHS